MKLSHPDDILNSLYRMHPEDLAELFNDERFLSACKKEDIISEYTFGKFRFTINETKNQLWIDKGHYNSWGSPGSSFKSFLSGINKYYFLEKVFPHSEVFDKRASLAAFRARLNEICPSYKSPNFIKDIRWEIKHATFNVASSEHFVSALSGIDVRFKYKLYHNDSNQDFDFDEYLSVFCNPWDFIITKMPKHILSYWDHFTKLQEALKTELETKK